MDIVGVVVCVLELETVAVADAPALRDCDIDGDCDNESDLELVLERVNEDVADFDAETDGVRVALTEGKRDFVGVTDISGVRVAVNVP